MVKTAARKLQQELSADRVVYLGQDRVLDEVVGDWAVELVGSRADDASIMARATARCLNGDPDEIDEFLSLERERTKLRMFESLAGERTKSVEMMGGKVAVMLHDKAHLEEEDILPATLLIFGRSNEPLVKLIGRRWFLSPGSFPEHGVMVVDDADEKLRATIYGPDFEPTHSQVLSAPKTLRMRVAGDG
jgi:hypothetical protein